MNTLKGAPDPESGEPWPAANTSDISASSDDDAESRRRAAERHRENMADPTRRKEAEETARLLQENPEVCSPGADGAAGSSQTTDDDDARHAPPPQILTPATSRLPSHLFPRKPLRRFLAARCRWPANWPEDSLWTRTMAWLDRPVISPENFTHLRTADQRHSIPSTLIISTSVDLARGQAPTIAVYFGPSNPHNLRLTLPPPQSPRDRQDDYRASLFALIAAVRAARHFCLPPSSCPPSARSLPRPAEQVTLVTIQIPSAAVLRHFHGDPRKPHEERPLQNWIDNSWRYNDGEPVRHRDLWMTFMSDAAWLRTVTRGVLVRVCETHATGSRDVGSQRAAKLAGGIDGDGAVGAKLFKGPICAADAVVDPFMGEFPYYYKFGWIKI
ncbi:ribonuclease [Colletotrichum asianum]|uniref:Ribonuclease n=1 Tax=Colletotrichum asianum TaxID=702518 RepID=A0A8H3W8D7_9PEZI|nr:ribonuclease [Colletotrichum asianum]